MSVAVICSVGSVNPVKSATCFSGGFIEVFRVNLTLKFRK